MNSYTINLLPKKKKQVADKLLYFVLHYFRYIIVLTQIIVISVFFYRFSQDQKIIDLKESFQQKQQILTITLPLIQEAQAVGANIKNVNRLLNYQDDFFSRFDFALGVVPQDIKLSYFQMDDISLEIRGDAGSINSIRSLNKRLQEKKEFTSSQIRSVDKTIQGEYSFVIYILLKNKNVKT